MRKQIQRIDQLRKERRAALYVISKDVLWGMFEQIQGNPEYLYGSDGIPENAIIDNVGWDMQHDGIVYRVLHESFDPLLEGMIPLYKSINITVKRVVK